MANLSKHTPEKEEELLAALREKPVFAAACRKARISRFTFYDWRRSDPGFNARILAAREEGLDALEDALTTRGMKNDTTAAIFMLKSLRRETYGERLAVNHGGTVHHRHTHDLSRLSDDELAGLELIILKTQLAEVTA